MCCKNQHKGRVGLVAFAKTDMPFVLLVFPAHYAPILSGQHSADPRLIAHTSFDFHISEFDAVHGWGGGADNFRANAADMYYFSFYSIHLWAGGDGERC